MTTYADRMRENYFFREYGLEPEFDPDDPTIEGFVHDEVVRQGWDLRTGRGRVRLDYMAQSWHYARQEARFNRYPTEHNMVWVARFVEPQENYWGYRRHGVQVGDRTAPEWHRVPELVRALWLALPHVVPEQGRAAGPHEPMSADDFYLEFELIHPFGDGNGRTGKVLHNWILGTLDRPVLVADYFGGGNP